MTKWKKAVFDGLAMAQVELPVMENFTMVNDSTSDDEQSHHGIKNAMIATVVITITLLTIIGNTAVITAIASYRTLRNEISNLLIINLSISDSVTAIFVMLSSFVSLVSDSWILGKAFCDFVCAINYCCIIVSMLTLCFISLDRYQAVIHALDYVCRITHTKICIMIVYSWCQGILFSSIPVIFNWIDYDTWEIVCAIQWHTERMEAVYYVIAAFTFCFLIPGSVLLYCYCRIRYVASKVGIQLSLPSRKHNKQKYSTSTKAVRSLMIVVFAYFICLTPFCVTKLIKVIVSHDDSIPGYINTIASIFQYCSSAINPFIYGIFRKDFRRAYKYTFSKIVKCKTKSNSSPSNIMDLVTVGSAKF